MFYFVFDKTNKLNDLSRKIENMCYVQWDSDSSIYCLIRILVVDQSQSGCCLMSFLFMDIRVWVFGEVVQCDQNSLAWIVLNKPFRSCRLRHFWGSCFRYLLAQRICVSTIASLVFLCREGQRRHISANWYPKKCLLEICRSAGTLLPEEPRTRTVVASHAFSSAGPRIWNSLDVETRKQKSFDTFKKKLKTFYFPIFEWISFLFFLSYFSNRL